jgi:hypothetical protein
MGPASSVTSLSPQTVSRLVGLVPNCFRYRRLAITIRIVKPAEKTFSTPAFDCYCPSGPPSSKSGGYRHRIKLIDRCHKISSCSSSPSGRHRCEHQQKLSRARSSIACSSNVGTSRWR